jgi:hypothetical protein
MMALLLFSCSDGETQRNNHPLLASNWGGTAGGPIEGRLEVQVFDDTTRFPFPGVIVSLGDSGRITATTDNQGIAVFNGVQGPQDIHVYACSGCDADPNNPGTPLLYQVASLYQVNANEVSIPVIPRDPRFSLGTFLGKVFDVDRSETAFVAAIDELGAFRIVGPLGSATYQMVSAESASPEKLTFVFTQDIDAWAAADPAGGRQGFNTVALLGKAINGSKKAQAGVRVTARYFNGADAGRAYYFNEEGKIDPALEATASNGRFLFLRLSPNNDLLVSSDLLGVGVGARYVHVPVRGTTVFTLPVLPLAERRLDLSGRVVVYRPDFREEERKGPLSSDNIGVEAAIINFSGDIIDESLVADSGLEIAGRYRAERHLLPNSRYIAVILAGRNFRPTYQELQLNSRSKSNYPLASVPLEELVEMVRRVKGDETTGLTANTAEIVGRIVAPTGGIDANGDPIVQPVAGAQVTIINELGDEITNRAYFNNDGVVDPCLEDPTPCPAPTATSNSGGFLAFDLTPGVYTVIATLGTDPDCKITIGRKSLPVYANSVHLMELVKTEEVEITLGPVLNASGAPVSVQRMSLIGGESGPNCPPVGEGRKLSASGEYIVRMSHQTGGGDYDISVSGSKRALGLTSFRVSPDGVLNNVTFAAGLGPLNAGGRLRFDISFLPPPNLAETVGSITLPTNFVTQDLQAVLVGSVGPRGETFIGADTTVFSGKTEPAYRALSLRPPEGVLSYFIMAVAGNEKGETSQVLAQGLPDLPTRQDLAFSAPPRLLSPIPDKDKDDEGKEIDIDKEVVVKRTTEVEVEGAKRLDVLERPSPQLVWAPPESGPVDFYRVVLETSDGEELWEAWVPGNRTEITLPAFPEEGAAEMNPFEFEEGPPEEWASQNKPPVVWRVSAIRAGGLSLHEFTFRRLARERVSVTSAESRFIPRWEHQ